MKNPDDFGSSSKPGVFTVIRSALAAVLGVQSDENRSRDFQHGSPLTFGIVALLTIVAFVLVIYAVVRLVLSSAGT